MYHHQLITHTTSFRCQQVFTDNVTQSTQDAADIVLVIDDSGSMNREHEWLLIMIPLLEQVLIDAGDSTSPPLLPLSPLSTNSFSPSLGLLHGQVNVLYIGNNI